MSQFERSAPASENPDRQSLRLAGALLAVGTVIYLVVTPLLHPGGGADPIAEFEGYANSRWWEISHSLQFLGWVIIAFGWLALVHGLNVSTGVRGLVSRFAAASAVAVIALNGAVYAVDGVALKQAVDVWINVQPAEESAYLAAVEGVRGVEWGLRGYEAYTVGLTLILIASVIVSTARVSRAIGYLMGLTGLVYIAQGIWYGGLHTATSDHAALGSVSYYALVLVLILAIWLLVVARRMPAPAAEAGRAVS
jgi:hypothetical protein